jgi:IPT/TIG domain
MASQPISSADAGTISLILDLIGDTLTPEQRAEIAAELTALRPEGVQPGDLITADLFNTMQSQINDLLIRMAALEGANGGPVITGITPSNQTILTSTLMSIVGRNFNIEPNRNVVRLGEATITQFRPGSNDTVLTFSVPAIFTDLPKTVEAVVETGGRRSNAFGVPLDSPPRQQIGEFDVTQMTIPPGPMIAGATITFGWDVFADTVLDDEMRFELSLANLAGATAQQWRAALSFSPTVPAAIGSRDTLRVNMTVTAPAGATSADLGLRVLGIGDQATGNSQAIQWRAGQPIEPSSNLAGLDFTILNDDGTNGSALRLMTNMNVGGLVYPRAIRVRAGQSDTLVFDRADNRPTGTELAAYSYSAALEINNGQFSIANGPTPPSHASVARGSTAAFSFDLANVSGAAGAVNFLRVTANQTATQGALAPFKTFVSIPLIIAA